LKKRNIIALLSSILLIIVLVTTGCIVNAATTAEREKTYSCVTPLGIQPPVTLSPLAPRLNTMDGKTIYIVQGEADPVIFPALNDAVRVKFPKTNWNYYNPSSSFGASTPDDQTKAEAQAVLRGIAW
jgi:hypothetical protein